MKHILSLDEMFKYGGDPSSSTPWREQWLDPSEKKFRCLVAPGNYSILVKSDAPNELWIYKNYNTYELPEFRKHLLRKEWINSLGEQKWDYKNEDDIAMEDFVTRLYRGDFEGKENEFTNPEIRTKKPLLYRLFSKEAVCDDPNQAINQWPYGEALLIRISGAMAQKMKEDFRKQLEEENGIIYETTRKIINLLEKVYPEGRLLPGEIPLEKPKS